MSIFDIAVNATNKQLVNDLDLVVERSLDAGVDKWLVIGSDVQESKDSLELVDRFAQSQLNVYTSAGVHPHDAKSVSASYIQELKQLHQHPSVVAVGECGLDFNRDFSPRPQQQQVFAEQLQLACELQKPVYMHERDAADTFTAILDQSIDKLSAGVVHCFTGNKHTLMNYLDRGLFIGITGWVCDERRGTELRELIQYIPRDRLMIETDAPFLLPRSLKPKPKSRRNEPAYLPHVAQTLAEILAVDEQQLVADIYHNSCQFFNISD